MTFHKKKLRVDECDTVPGIVPHSDTMVGMETNAENSQGTKGSKTGLAVTAMVLVAVLVAAFVGYNALAQSESPRGSGATTESGEQLALLADYNSTVYSEDDVPIMLSETADGKPLVINFWATWCPYCLQEMDDYQQLYDEYGERVSFAFIDCVDGKRETVADGAAWLAENGHDLPAYFDTDREAVRDFGAGSLPTTVVVNASGEITAASTGVIDPDLMRDELDSVLAEQ